MLRREFLYLLLEAVIFDKNYLVVRFTSTYIRSWEKI